MVSLATQQQPGLDILPWAGQGSGQEESGPFSRAFQLLSLAPQPPVLNPIGLPAVGRNSQTSAPGRQNQTSGWAAWMGHCGEDPQSKVTSHGSMTLGGKTPWGAQCKEATVSSSSFSTSVFEGSILLPGTL